MKRVKSALRESRDLGRLLATPADDRPIVFYAEDTFTYVQFEGYLSALRGRTDNPVLYVTSAADDPVLDTDDPGLTPFYIDRQLPRLFDRLDSRVLALTMPDLGQFQVHKPPVGNAIYLFHSLNSAHTAYRTGAFDNYDVFFCCGSHHVRELRALRENRGLPPAELLEVGYYKLDRIATAHDSYEAKLPNETTALIAPSWGPGNIFESCGEEVVSSLRAEGFRVIVRPHPQFFHGLYPAGRTVVDNLQQRFAGDDLVEFELSIETEDSFHEADLMVSDWSGAAFEYALGTLRPVLFVETPQKIFNQGWEDLGLPSFERSMRREVGRVVAPGVGVDIGRFATDLIDSADEWRDKLRQLRAETVFNFGQAGEVGGTALVDRVS